MTSSTLMFQELVVRSFGLGVVSVEFMVLEVEFNLTASHKMRPSKSGRSMLCVWAESQEHMTLATLKKINQTSAACPSQWDAWDVEGNYYYIRYRWGILTVDKAASQDEWTARTWFSGVIFDKDVGDDLDGFMTLSDMLGHTGLELAEGAKVESL